MKAMMTLTVAEGKRLIAKGIARMPAVVAARAGGKIFMKGGTTVSAVESVRNSTVAPAGRVPR